MTRFLPMFHILSSYNEIDDLTTFLPIQRSTTEPFCVFDYVLELLQSFFTKTSLNLFPRRFLHLLSQRSVHLIFKDRQHNIYRCTQSATVYSWLLHTVSNYTQSGTARNWSVYMISHSTRLVTESSVCVMMSAGCVITQLAKSSNKYKAAATMWPVVTKLYGIVLLSFCLKKPFSQIIFLCVKNMFCFCSESIWLLLLPPLQIDRHKVLYVSSVFGEASLFAARVPAHSAICFGWLLNMSSGSTGCAPLHVHLSARFHSLFNFYCFNSHSLPAVLY